MIEDLKESFFEQDKLKIPLTSFKATKLIGTLPSYVMNRTIPFSVNMGNLAGPDSPAAWNRHQVTSFLLFGLGSTDMGMSGYRIHRILRLSLIMFQNLTHDLSFQALIAPR
jgi:hypothetical protein